MKNFIFDLSTQQLKEISLDLQAKIYTGLEKDGEEIACLPTYINPGKDFEGKVLALDWGGTNFRAAIIQFKKGEKPVVLDNQKTLLSDKETKNFTGEKLCNEMASLIAQLKFLDNSVTHIGYCFSYEAESMPDGDAVVLQFAKGINIPDMLNKLVGKPLLECLNNYNGIKEKTQFKTIKVINDTIACLFAGLEQPGFDRYIGLIVGTGKNMASAFSKEQIKKLSRNYQGGDLIPVNLESGNLQPCCSGLWDDIYLTKEDKIVDLSLPEEEQQDHLFEKAMSGKYIGEIFRNYFSDMEIDPEFDGKSLTDILSYPAIYKDECVLVARQIYVRSAKLVSAALAGLILVLVSYKNEKDFDKSIIDICIAADGSLFWSEDKTELDYNELVKKFLEAQLADFGLGHINFQFSQLNDANLIGSAIAALS